MTLLLVICILWRGAYYAHLLDVFLGDPPVQYGTTKNKNSSFSSSRGSPLFRGASVMGAKLLISLPTYLRA